ncbi:hypothetical protein FJZ19_05460 [Candidatus Pacearchaeota archaeon]|nr:hypothetical protein [Candidatus Pacearchaeota archaeon]
MLGFDENSRYDNVGIRYVTAADGVTTLGIGLFGAIVWSSRPQITEADKQKWLDEHPLKCLEEVN